MSLLLFSLLTSFLVGFGTQAVRIEVDPAKCISTLEKEVQISCLPDNDKEQEITLMELSRNNEDPLAFINQCDAGPRLRDPMSNRFKVVGHVGKGDDQSYLNMTLGSPNSRDTGVYTCVLYYLDKTGRLTMQTASENLLVERMDVTSLETVLNQMKESMKAMKKKNDELQHQDAKLMDRITALEITSGNQSAEIDGLTDKSSYQNAFSVTNKNVFTTNGGKVLILPDILLRIGQGYDVDTGIFTAPKAGIYIFHLTVHDTQPKYVINMEIKVNGKTVARVKANDSSTGDQSSISSVVSLTVGDKVFTRMMEGNCRVGDDMYTIFSGYLLKAS